MKIVNTRNVFLIIFVTQLSLLFFACSGDPIVHDPEVETVISDFEGNDGASVDLKGNIYISGFGAFENGAGTGTKVIKVGKNGSIKKTITGLEGPLGNAIDILGNLYVVHANNPTSGSGKILKISPSGAKTILAEIEGFPSGLTLDDATNTLYIANFATPTIHRITSDGDISIFASDPRLAGCVGIDMDSNGNIITANYSTAEILSIDPEGTVTSIVTIPNTTIIGYITILNNAIYATALAEHKIFKVGMNGTVETFAGTGVATQKDGLLLEASFNGPNGITADRLRNILYISEFGTPGGLRKIQL